MNLFLFLIQIPVLIFVIRYIRKLHSDPLLINAYYYLISLKVTAGLLLGIIYFNYYKVGDTNLYLHEFDTLSKIFFYDFKSYVDLIFFREGSLDFKNALYTFPKPRAYTFIRIVSPFYILSGSNYWILSIYLSLFSFFGLWILSNTLLKLFNLNSLAVMISFFVFPSVVFWSAGVIKESLIIGMMGIMISIILKFVHQQEKFSILNFFILSVFAGILLLVKFYYFAVLTAVIVPYGIVVVFSKKVALLRNKKAYRILFLFSLIAVMTFISSFADPKLGAGIIFETLFLNYDFTLYTSKGLNTFVFEGLNSDPESFLVHIPKALLYGLFGPFLWQCKKIISLVNGIENTILLIAFITFLIENVKKEKLLKIDIKEISLTIYIAVLAIFMAFASPNWGSLVRYKIGFLPFFLLLILNNNPFVFQLEKVIRFLKPSKKKS
jgi:hypothetical protein